MRQTRIYESKGFYAEYTVCGWLLSWWRRPTRETPANYIEKLPVISARSIAYGVEGMRRDDPKDQFDGWPERIPPVDEIAPPQTRARPKVEDLL